MTFPLWVCVVVNNCKLRVRCWRVCVCKGCGCGWWVLFSSFLFFLPLRHSGVDYEFLHPRVYSGVDHDSWIRDRQGFLTSSSIFWLSNLTNRWFYYSRMKKRRESGGKFSNYDAQWNCETGATYIKIHSHHVPLRQIVEEMRLGKE